jgi:hypothetical protein
MVVDLQFILMLMLFVDLHLHLTCFIGLPSSFARKSAVDQISLVQEFFTQRLILIENSFVGN